MSKTQINSIVGDWKNIKNKCRTTVNKDYSDKNVTPKFKEDLLISEHSPIRLLEVDWSWKGIKSWIAVHFSRHKWECFVSTQRTDRTGVDRNTLPQDTLVNMDGVANAQHLIDMARKRLCYQSSRETREYAEDLKIEIKPYEPQVADTLVPNCIYRCGCPEFEQCQQRFWDNFVANNKDVNMLDIRARYKAYNDYFYARKVK